MYPRITPPLRYTFESIVNYWFQTAFADVLAKIAERDFYPLRKPRLRASRATSHPSTWGWASYATHWTHRSSFTWRGKSRVRSSRLTGGLAPTQVVRWDSLKNLASSFLTFRGSPLPAPLGFRRFSVFTPNRFATVSRQSIPAIDQIIFTSAEHWYKF